MSRRKWSMIVKAKEPLKLSYSGPSQRQVSGTNKQVKVLRQGRLRLDPPDTV